MITIKKVDESNFQKVVDIKVADNQKQFVASNIRSLAQAWLYYTEARPYAIYNDDEVVGFLMLDWDEKEAEVGIWRFMIDEKHQNKGYGREAVRLTIQMARESGKFEIMHLDYAPQNTVARNLYASFGFKETGEVEDDGEIVMVLKFDNT